jgi:hypothetical protein
MSARDIIHDLLGLQVGIAEETTQEGKRMKRMETIEYNVLRDWCLNANPKDKG